MASAGTSSSVPAGGGTPRQLTHDNGQIHGLAWLPDSTGIIYSSGRGRDDAVPANARPVGGHARGRPTPGAIAAADVSYLHPDVHESGAMRREPPAACSSTCGNIPSTAARTRTSARGVRLTRQTGQVQTPTVGASDRQVAFLSDSGGHANLWVATPDTGEMRQITHERDPSVCRSACRSGRRTGTGSRSSPRAATPGSASGSGRWTRDGGNLRKLVRAWSRRGVVARMAAGSITSTQATVYKTPAGGGPAVQVRPGPARNVVGSDGTTLYFMVDRTLDRRHAGLRDPRRVAGRRAVARPRANSRRAARRSGRSSTRRCRPMASGWRCR